MMVFNDGGSSYCVGYFLTSNPADVTLSAFAEYQPPFLSVFSHGQLYVALSQCTSGNHIKVLFPETQNDTRTHNVVYNEILPGVL